MNSVKQVQNELADMRIRMREIERLLQLQGLTAKQTSPAGIQKQQAQRIPVRGDTYYLDGNGDAVLNAGSFAGFTTLGNSPALKSKVVSLTISNPVAGNQGVAHGIGGMSKMVAWMSFVDTAGGGLLIPTNHTAIANVEFEDLVDNTYIYFIPVSATGLAGYTFYSHILYKA